MRLWTEADHDLRIDITWGDDSVPSNSWWTYQTGGALREPRLFLHNGMELLVELNDVGVNYAPLF